MFVHGWVQFCSCVARLRIFPHPETSKTSYRSWIQYFLHFLQVSQISDTTQTVRMVPDSKLDKPDTKPDEPYTRTDLTPTGIGTRLPLYGFYFRFWTPTTPSLNVSVKTLIKRNTPWRTYEILVGTWENWYGCVVYCLRPDPAASCLCMSSFWLMMQFFCWTVGFESARAKIGWTVLRTLGCVPELGFGLFFSGSSAARLRWLVCECTQLFTGRLYAKWFHLKILRHVETF